MKYEKTSTRGGNNYPVDKGEKADCISFLSFCLLPPAFCLLPSCTRLLAKVPNTIKFICVYLRPSAVKIHALAFLQEVYCSFPVGRRFKLPPIKNP
jgi:hypothetical protein